MTPDDGRVPRVLHVIDSMRSGGAERYLATLVPELAQARLADSIVRVASSMGANPGIAASVRGGAVDFTYVESTALYDPRLYRELGRTIRRWRVDVVHSHLNNSNTTSRLVAALLGKPHVATIHTPPGPLAEDASRRILADGATARLSNRIVGVSPHTVDAYARAFRVPMSRCLVIPTAPQHRPPQPGFDRASMRRELVGGDDVKLVCAMSRLTEAKGLDDLIHAVARLRPELPELRVVIAGAGPDERRLRRLIAESALESAVNLVGHRDDVGNLLGAADAFVLPSHHEGLPVSVLEAMAAGVPCVATAVGGTSLIVKDGSTGLLVRPKAPEELARGLRRVLLDDALASRLRAQAFRLVEESFDRRSVAREYAGLYRDLVRLGRHG